MKSNPEKCSFLCSSSKKVSSIVGNKETNNSTHERLLGVKINLILSFNTHIHDICKIASLELNALSRITPQLDFKKKRLLNSFLMFNYYHLICMCHNHTKSNKINRLHERCSRLLYNDKKSPFHDLLEKDSSVSIHHMNLRALSSKLYEIYNGMAPEIVTGILPSRRQDQYNLRSWSDFTLPIVRTVNYGIESIRYLGTKIWKSISANIKKVDTKEHFKSGIKKWKPESCLCRLCKTNLQQIGHM